MMVYVLGQKPAVAENRSLVLAALVLVYMIMFGHGLPTSINKDLMARLIWCSTLPKGEQKISLAIYAIHMYL